MHENSGNSVIYYAHYTEGGVNKTGLTVTITVYEVIRDGTKTEVVTDGACTEIGDGLYRYLLASGTVDAAAEYVAVFHTATDTVDAQDIPAMWVIDRAGSEKLDTGVTLADDAITADKFDENTAYPLKSADTGATAVARVGADSDTLETLSDQLDLTALEATLTAIKGPGWVSGDHLHQLKSYSDSIYSTLSNGGRTDLLIDSIIQHLLDIKGDDGWTGQSLESISTDIYHVDTAVNAIKAKTDNLPATPAQAGEYTAAIAAVQADLDNPDQYKADVSALATTAHVQEVEDKVDIVDGIVDGILVDTGTTLDTLIKDIPTNAELATALGTADDAVLAAVAAAKSVIDNIHDTDLPAVKAETALILEDTGTTIPALLETIDNFLDTEVAAILEDTGTTLPATLATIAGYTDGIAGDVWSHPHRTLTVPAVAASATEDGTTLTLYKDADINIEFTGLTIPTGAKKVVFTIKDNLDDADTASALQATYQLTAVPAETHTLNYINSAAPPVLTTPVTFTVDTDSVEFDMTAAAAYYLPRYERGYLHWDLKLITATTVQILQQGLVQILGTSTRTVA